MKMRVENGMILLNITRKQLAVILCKKMHVAAHYL